MLARDDSARMSAARIGLTQSQDVARRLALQLQRLELRSSLVLV